MRLIIEYNSVLGLDDLGIDNFTLTSSGGSTVPLPSAAWAGLGLLGLIGAVRRYRRKVAA